MRLPWVDEPPTMPPPWSLPCGENFVRHGSPAAISVPIQIDVPDGYGRVGDLGSHAVVG